MDLVDALERGRDDIPFFSHHFLRRRLHDGQVEWVNNANATCNVLFTGNRWGKSTVICVQHFHACIYKTDALVRLTEDGEVDQAAFGEERYQTVHAANVLDTTLIVWNEAVRIIRGSKLLQPFIHPYPPPRAKPPTIGFFHGSEWRFRTIGDDGSGVDGNSFYVLSVDEAGWIKNLETIYRNVLRVRVADVRGRIILAGTAKPGAQSADFHAYAVRAASASGSNEILEHRPGVGWKGERRHGLDQSLYRYANRWGYDLDALVDLVKKKGVAA